MKKRRFAAGGETFSPEQEKWLGGADRTDPYILARMRRAVPDTPSSASATAPAPSKVPAAALAAANATDDSIGSLYETQNWGKKDEPTPATKAAKSSESELDRPRRTSLYQEPSKAETTDRPRRTSLYQEPSKAETTDRPRRTSLYQEPRKTDLAAMERRSATRRADVAARKPAAERRGDVRLLDSRNLPQKEKMKHGGAVKRYANGGSVSSRADGIAAKGKTRGKMC